MTTAVYLSRVVIPGALQVLPAPMDSPAARSMLLAIALQESNCCARRQLNGPARGFWQFEIGGVRGVLSHPASKPHLAEALALLSYPVTADATLPYMALEHNDILAAILARLLLWTDPTALPAADDAETGWTIYARTWRPGKPRKRDWPANFAQAWAA